MSGPPPASPDPSDLRQVLSTWLPDTTFPPAGSSLRCGVSGGADSLALMALAVAAGCEVTAVHVDHGQRPTSAGEALLVERYAAAVGAQFESERVTVEPGSNLEARMRTARYNVLGNEAATGHTADDQAETLLINLVRGSGLVGVGAMTPGYRRPILSLRRSDTEAICETLGWDPVLDESNSDPAFLRNRMRHEVIPLLNDVAGRDVAPLLERTSDHARAAAQVLREQAQELDPTDAKQLSAAPPPVAAIAVQDWIRAETGDEYRVDAASVERVLDVARGTSKAAEVTGGWRVHRSKQRLHLSAANGRESVS